MSFKAWRCSWSPCRSSSDAYKQGPPRALRSRFAKLLFWPQRVCGRQPEPQKITLQCSQKGADADMPQPCPDQDSCRGGELEKAVKHASSTLKVSIACSHAAAPDNNRLPTAILPGGMRRQCLTPRIRPGEPHPVAARLQRKGLAHPFPTGHTSCVWVAQHPASGQIRTTSSAGRPTRIFCSLWASATSRNGRARQRYVSQLD